MLDKGLAPLTEVRFHNLQNSSVSRYHYDTGLVRMADIVVRYIQERRLKLDAARVRLVCQRCAKNSREEGVKLWGNT